MKIGDRVRILTIPAALPEGAIHTNSLFKLCKGRVFSIVGFQENLVELEVGKVLGREPFMESIWIEREHLELVATPD